jgi:hypothetical protein
VRPLLPALLALIALGAIGCDKGDYAGGAERAAREIFNGWDMWETPAVQPHELPMPLPPPATVSLSGTIGFGQARQQLAALDPAGRDARSALVYRRYCHHCHGPNGDGRIIVGESFGVRPGDLRSPEVQARSDRELYDHVTYGSDVLIPLAAVVTPLDRLLAIEYVRKLADAPSEPFYEPRNREPVR